MTVTTMYLIRHGATAANLARPYRLQGRHCDDPLSPQGTRQAELTREALAHQPPSCFYSSPLRRAVETARIIAGPLASSVMSVNELTECDVGGWEGLTWETIRAQDAAACERFLADPAANGYPGGENFQQVADRVMPVINRLLEGHAGQSILVVGHHVVNRVYLAGLLGLSPSKARQVQLDNCGISIVERNGLEARVALLNGTDHLRGLTLAA